MLKNKMWHSECCGRKKNTLCLPCKRIDKFLFSTLKSNPKGNGTEKTAKRIKHM
jgi:hypothetical protein